MTTTRYELSLGIGAPHDPETRNKIAREKRRILEIGPEAYKAELRERAKEHIRKAKEIVEKRK